MRIEDGMGRGFIAGISSEHQLFTQAQTFDMLEWHALKKAAYTIYSTILTLTTAGESALLYIKNTDPLLDMVIKYVNISLGRSTGGTPGTCVVKRYITPTGGTIISDASLATVTNKDQLVATPIQALAYKGAEGKTATGGVEIASWLATDGSPLLDLGHEAVLQSGATTVFSVTPPTSNTSMKVSINVQLAMVNLELGV